MGSLGVYLWYVFFSFLGEVRKRKVLMGNGGFYFLFFRANKAQFSEVALRSIEEDEVFEAGLPSVQGLDDDSGRFSVFSFQLTLLFVC